MKSFGLPALLLGASLGQAATLVPTCASLGSLQGLLSNGTCTAGIFTIKNPAFSGPAGVAASDITLNVVYGANTVSLGFGGGQFVSGPLSNRSFTFGYTIDPPPDIIKGITGDLQDAGQDFFDIAGLLGPAGVGDAISVQYLLCAGAAFVDGACAGVSDGFSLTLPDSSLTVSALISGGVVFPSPVNTVGVLIMVDLQNGGRFGSINSSFPLSDVPEPGTMALLAGAGLALAAYGRGRRQSA